MSDIHERLIEARKAAKFETAADACRAKGFNYPTYIAHENGSRGITRDAALRYAHAYSVNIDWLLRERGPMKGKPRESQQVLDIYESLPPDRQAEWLDFGAFLRQRGE